MSVTTLNEQAAPRKRNRENTPWLNRYEHLFSSGDWILDLGCGVGDDSVQLAAYGCEVVSLDVELDRIRHVPNSATRLRLIGDVSGKLPFTEEAFDGVIASLSLHYFTEEETERAIGEVARILKPGGWFLCRVNAVGDINFGYGAGIEVEPSLFLQPEGHLKRFFDPEMLRRFLEPCFTLGQISTQTILQRDIEKRTLECLARKR
jgi:SAM-dependent methyltransferase